MFMKPFAQKFYLSQAWIKCRNAYVKSVGGLCEECLKKGIYKPIEEVHHKIFLTPNNISNPNVTLNWENLIGLCRECHKEMHSNKVVRYTVDERGRVAPR